MGPLDPDPGGKKLPTKAELINFIFEVLDVLFWGLKASPVLEVFYGGLVISKLQSSKKRSGSTTLMEVYKRNDILNDCSTLCKKHDGPLEVGSGKQGQDPDPDLDVRSKDPQIRIRSNMSRIMNTACFRKLEPGNENWSTYIP
jgi:hypothetical protein